MPGGHVFIPIITEIHGRYHISEFLDGKLGIIFEHTLQKVSDTSVGNAKLMLPVGSDDCYFHLSCY